MYDFEAARADGVTQLGHPPLLLGLAEPLRVPVEVAGWAGLTLWERLRPPQRAARARTVLVIPGFMATDHLTAPLRGSLARAGHRVHPVGLGPMVGLTDAILDGLLARIDELADRSGGSITVIGWSFGGLLARWVAHERPELVEYVITVGSPWRPEGELTRSTAMFRRSARRHGLADRAAEVVGTLRETVPAPVTALYSTTDGMVPWRACRAEEGPGRENVAVPSSHFGLVSNPLVIAVLRERLAQDPPQREPFGYSAVLPPRHRSTAPLAGSRPPFRRPTSVTAEGEPR